MTDSATANSAQDVRLPGYGSRFLAFLFDSAVPIAVILATSVMGSLSVLSAGQTLVLVVLVALVMGLTNGTITWLSGGATVGKAWAGLQVRRLNQQTIAPAAGELPKVLVRHTVGYYLIDVLLIGSLNAFRDSRRRPLHDYVLGFEVVALASVPDSAKDRLRIFGQDLAAGQALVRERWGVFGGIVSAYVSVVGTVNQSIVWIASQLGLSSPTAAAAPATGSAAVAVPSTGVAVGLTAGGTALTAAAVSVVAGTTGIVPADYPDEIPLVAAVQYEETAYPLDVPSDITLRLNRGEPLTDAQLEEYPMLASADWATATLTYADGELEGLEFTFEDVVVPVEWQFLDPTQTGLFNWSELNVSAPDEAGFVAVGTPVADVGRVGDVTYAGYTVAGPGELSMSFPYRVDEPGAVDEVGVVVDWTGDMSCIVTNDNPAEGFDAAANCTDKVDDMFWVWGASGVTFG